MHESRWMWAIHVVHHSSEHYNLSTALRQPWVPMTALPFWLPLCLAFILPFLDPRRPFRLLHLDLLVMLGFGVSHFFFNRADISASTPLAYPVLAYLLVRAAMIGFRPRKRPGPLVPLVPIRWLAAGQENWLSTPGIGPKRAAALAQTLAHRRRRN